MGAATPASLGSHGSRLAGTGGAAADRGKATKHFNCRKVYFIFWEGLRTMRTVAGSPSQVSGAGRMVIMPSRLPNTTSVMYRSPTITKFSALQLRGRG